MSVRARITIAAVVTALFLGVISAAGLVARNDKPVAAPSPPAAVTHRATPPTQAYSRTDERDDGTREGATAGEHETDD